MIPMGSPFLVQPTAVDEQMPAAIVGHAVVQGVKKHILPRRQTSGIHYLPHCPTLMRRQMERVVRREIVEDVKCYHRCAAAMVVKEGLHRLVVHDDHIRMAQLLHLLLHGEFLPSEASKVVDEGHRCTSPPVHYAAKGGVVFLKGILYQQHIALPHTPWQQQQGEQLGEEHARLSLPSAPHRHIVVATGVGKGIDVSLRFVRRMDV